MKIIKMTEKFDLRKVRESMWREFNANAGLVSMQQIRKSVEWADKEFIRLLKEEIKDKFAFSENKINSMIDKLAGILEVEKETEMYCAVEGCGKIDETHTAYCIKHGRSPHRIRKK